MVRMVKVAFHLLPLPACLSSPSFLLKPGSQRPSPFILRFHKHNMCLNSQFSFRGGEGLFSNWKIIFYIFPNSSPECEEKKGPECGGGWSLDTKTRLPREDPCFHLSRALKECTSLSCLCNRDNHSNLPRRGV